METIVERPAALDVHKAQVTACVRVPAAAGGREQHVAEFQTTVRGLLGLRDWLAAHRVRQVVMEATGVYWKPVWAILEAEFECVLINARHVKQVPGRKTDVSDAAWLCQLAEAGLLKASFGPPKPVRQLRNLTRYRKTQIQERAREVNRLHKALEDAGIKLDCVATDILGKSGRDMLDALVRGTTDPDVLADLARRQMRKKIPALREALEGHFDAHHALWVGAILAHVDFLDEQIDRLSDAIEEQIRPFAPAVELLCTIPGIHRRGAECIIGEIGADMSRFASARHLASWAGQCPGNDQSAGRRRSGKTRNGSKWLDYALEEAAMAAIRVRDGYLAAQYRRLKPRRGHKKALGAVKHSLICAIWHMLATGETYRDLGSDYFTNRDPARQTSRLVNSSNASDTTSRSPRGPRQPERTFPTRQLRKRGRRRPSRPLVVRSGRLGLNHGGRSLRLGEATATPFRRVGSRAAGVHPDRDLTGGRAVGDSACTYRKRAEEVGMKYFVAATPGPMPPTPEQFDAAIAWLQGRLDDGTFDCLYGFMEGGGFSIANADSHREVLDMMAAYPLFGRVTFEVRPLLEFKEGIDTIRAKLVEAQEAMAAR